MNLSHSFGIVCDCAGFNLEGEFEYEEIRDGKVALLHSRMPVVKIEDEDMKSYGFSICGLAQGDCTKIVYHIVSNVNILFCTLVSLYENDIML
jgi:hypothetical protein